MESIWQAIILGIIQGLTEFLPVSSSGHLELTKFILEDDSIPEESLLMTVVLHAATAFSTVVVFWKEIKEIIAGLLLFKWNEEFKFSLKIVVSMIPAAFVGVFFDEEIDALFGGEILLVGSMLFITGLLLFLADKAQKTEKSLSFGNAWIIGLAQAIAILPGISRSGATISTSVLLGIDRERAARFSFLMVVLAAIFTVGSLKTKENFYYILVSILTCVAIYYFKDLSIALGQTEKISLTLSVWMPIIAVTLLSYSFCK